MTKPKHECASNCQLCDCEDTLQSEKEEMCSHCKIKDLRKGEERPISVNSDGVITNSSSLKIKRYVIDKNGRLKEKDIGRLIFFDDVKKWHSKQECPKWMQAYLNAKEDGWKSPEDWQKAKEQLQEVLDKQAIKISEQTPKGELTSIAKVTGLALILDFKKIVKEVFDGK